MVMKTYWGSGGIIPYILNLDIGWIWVVSLMCKLLYPRGKRPHTPWIGSWVRPQSQSGHSGKEKNSPSLPGHSLAIIQTEL